MQKESFALRIPLLEFEKERCCISTQSQYATYNKNAYNSMHYDRISLVLKNSFPEEGKNKAGLRRLAAEHNMSVNAFIIYCINTVAGEEVIEQLDNYTRRPMQVSQR